MSILITDLEMPAERGSFNLTIKYNGLVFDTETGIQVAEAQEVPPHGRLIDADALCNRLEKAGKIKPYLESALNVAISFALTAPTIIPAEEGE